MAIILKMSFNLILIGALVIDVMSFNPLLTYTVRFKKISVKPNITINNYSIDQYKDIQYLNGDVTLNTKEQINKVVAILNRCDPDGINCEYFKTLTFTDVCRQLKEKNQIWSRLYDSFDPPARCPLDKVYYKIKNATFDVDILTLLYPQVKNYQWKIIQNAYADDTFIGSYTIEIYFFGYRK
ncbi:uncharacterized protein LOC112599868, partial [Melanaphis sacchari]|uniref:uncharacterized protein LOC112599868 n=1 Tax=Melanaphis sacchari TaxID=742174 RepID=UPI000DC15604